MRKIFVVNLQVNLIPRSRKKSTQSLPIFTEFKGGINPTQDQQSMATILHANNAYVNVDSTLGDNSLTHQEQGSSFARRRLKLVPANNDEEQDYFFLAILISGSMIIVLMISLYIVIILMSVLENSQLLW